jgi:hypothetical protein
MCLRVSYKKQIWGKNDFLASLNITEKRIGSGSIRQRYESTDPDSHQNVTDPQQCMNLKSRLYISRFFFFYKYWWLVPLYWIFISHTILMMIFCRVHTIFCLGSCLVGVGLMWT